MAASDVQTGSADVEAVDDQERLETVPNDHQQEAQTDEDGDGDDDEDDEQDNPRSDLPFPLFASKAFYVLDQTTAPRRWCLQLITSPYPLRQLHLSVVTRTVIITCVYSFFFRLNKAQSFRGIFAIVFCLIRSKFTKYDSFACKLHPCIHKTSFCNVVNYITD